MCVRGRGGRPRSSPVLWTFALHFPSGHLCPCLPSFPSFSSSCSSCRFFVLAPPRPQFPLFLLLFLLCLLLFAYLFYPLFIPMPIVFFFMSFCVCFSSSTFVVCFSFFSSFFSPPPIFFFSLSLSLARSLALLQLRREGHFGQRPAQALHRPAGAFLPPPVWQRAVPHPYGRGATAAPGAASQEAGLVHLPPIPALCHFGAAHHPAQRHHLAHQLSLPRVSSNERSKKEEEEREKERRKKERKKERRSGKENCIIVNAVVSFSFLFFFFSLAGHVHTTHLSAYPCIINNFYCFYHLY